MQHHPDPASGDELVLRATGEVAEVAEVASIIDQISESGLRESVQASLEEGGGSLRLEYVGHGTGDRRKAAIHSQVFRMCRPFGAARLHSVIVLRYILCPLC